MMAQKVSHYRIDKQMPQYEEALEAYNAGTWDTISKLRTEIGAARWFTSDRAHTASTTWYEEWFVKRDMALRALVADRTSTPNQWVRLHVWAHYEAADANYRLLRQLADDFGLFKHADAASDVSPAENSSGGPMRWRRPTNLTAESRGRRHRSPWSPWRQGVRPGRGRSPHPTGRRRRGEPPPAEAGCGNADRSCPRSRHRRRSVRSFGRAGPTRRHPGHRRHCRRVSPASEFIRPRIQSGGDSVVTGDPSVSGDVIEVRAADVGVRDLVCGLRQVSSCEFDEVSCVSITFGFEHVVC